MVRIPVAVRPTLLDAALAAALLAGTVLLNLSGEYAVKLRGQFGSYADYERAALLWWLFAAAIVAGLVVQHRWPLAGFVLAAAGTGAHQLLPQVVATPLLDYAVPLVLYTLANLARTRWVPVLALVLAAVGHYAIALIGLYPLGQPLAAGKDGLGGGPPLAQQLLQPAPKSVELLLLLVLAVALGEGTRARRVHLADVERRAADREREQQQRAALAIAGERARITRELHDVVAHGLSVMVVQAQGGAAALRHHPERTAAALQDVIAVGRASLAEMRRLLGVVRRDPALDAGDPALAPQPGLAVLPDLVDQVRAVGTPVRFEVRGEPVALPAGIDLSGYRIVQEALTNALKHAGPGASVDVAVTFAPDRLTIEVTDDGVGPAGVDGPADGAGSGLRGIAERVTMLSGTLTTGPGDDRGFRVRAELPLAADPALTP